MTEPSGTDLCFTGDIWYWRGPSPFHFVTVPDEQSRNLRAVSTAVTYGWGMIPVRARIGATEWETSLFPKDGRYVLPVKDAVCGAEGLDDGDTAAVRLSPARRAGRLVHPGEPDEPRPAEDRGPLPGPPLPRH